MISAAALSLGEVRYARGGECTFSSHHPCFFLKFVLEDGIMSAEVERLVAGTREDWDDGADDKWL